MRLNTFFSRFVLLIFCSDWFGASGFPQLTEDKEISLRQFLLFKQTLKDSKSLLDKVHFPEKPKYDKSRNLLSDLFKQFDQVDSQSVSTAEAKEKAIWGGPPEAVSSVMRELAPSQGSEKDLLLISDYQSQKSELCRIVNETYETFRALRKEFGRYHLLWSHTAQQSTYIAEAKHLFKKGMIAIYCKE